MAACESLSLASWSARAVRLFSRASHSASTRSPKRSSKVRAAHSALRCWSCQAAAMAVSLRLWSCSIVGAVSIRMILPGSSSGPADAPGLGRGGWGGGEWGRGRGGAEAVEAVLEDGIDVAVGAGAGGQGARTRRFQARGAIPLAQAEQPEAGAEAP